MTDRATLESARKLVVWCSDELERLAQPGANAPQANYKFVHAVWKGVKVCFPYGKTDYSLTDPERAAYTLAELWDRVLEAVYGE